MSQRFCTQCGAKLPEDGKFCPHCGAPVEQEAGSAPAPAATPVEARSVTQLDAEIAAQSSGGESRTESSNTLLYALGGAAIIIVLLAGAYFAFLRPGDADSLASTELSDCGDEPCTVEAVTAVSQNDPSIPYPEITRISVDDAHMRLANNSAIFVDVRDRDSYTAMHVPGALWIPLDEVSARQGELPKDAEILTYCT